MQKFNNYIEEVKSIFNTELQTKKQKVFIISAMSAAGKDFLKSTLQNDGFFKQHNIYCPISTTTRKQRPGEINGGEYWFIQPEQMKDIKEIDIVEPKETWNIMGNNYFYTKNEFIDPINNGKNIFLISLAAKKQMFVDFINSHFENIDITSIYLHIDKKTQIERMKQRDPTISQQEVERRVLNNKQDNEIIKQIGFDYYVDSSKQLIKPKQKIKTR